jgi:hypothetical protein
MKRTLLTLASSIMLTFALTAPAQGAPGDECEPVVPVFGLCAIDLTITDENGDPSMQAGSHPFALTTDISLNTETQEGPDGIEVVPTDELKDLRIHTPPGLVGTPTPGPRCPSADFIVGGAEGSKTNCPAASAVGIATVEYEVIGHTATVPVYNLVPAPGVAAKIGFVVANVAPVTIDLSLNPDPPYNVIAEMTNVTQVKFVYGGKASLWGVPADPRHDDERGKCVIDGGSCPVSVPEVPFLTLPTRCEGPLEATFEADSWQDPGEPYSSKETIQTHDDSEPPLPLGPTGCDKLAFEPSISSLTTSDQASSPTGLDFGVDVKDEGLTNPTGLAASQIKKAVVTLPEGVTLNPSIAEGLAVCSAAQYAAEGLDAGAGEGCPPASKVGTIEVETPLLEGTLLRGSVFVAQQDDPSTAQPGAENPFDSLLAIYLTIEEPVLGAFVKLAGKVTPDPATGQLITTVEGIPQFPFSHFRFHFREGGRSPLVTPSGCGTYTTKALFTPWADPSEPLETTSTMQITRGVGGGPCPPAGAPPFEPGFTAGTLNNDAGSYSPFYMQLRRRDGDQDMTRFSAVLPPGVTGKLAGIAKCPEAAIAAAKAKSGRSEIASPSCPSDSEIGSTQAGAGVGSQLTYVGGKLYLAGPVGSAPLSVVAITPAVAGPFDIGNVVVRVALKINPDTAEVETDGANSDPIPHILEGIPVKVRDLRVFTGRPQFTLNPTNCEPSSAKATLFGSYLDVFNPADDVPVSLSDRFQAANCASLGFKPRLAMRLKGGTRRGANPSFTAVLTPRPGGDANLAGASVTLPRSAFLDQAHIRTICTRVQFAAKTCPPGSVYGKATVHTPLLDDPLTGPVYLRSSNHKLPDLVLALHGLVDINLIGRIDSHKGGIRTSFEGTPDAPFSKAILQMQGGNKGLIVNSRNLCAHRSRAKARLAGQNGRRHSFAPVVRPTSCKATSSRRAKRRG